MHLTPIYYSSTQCETEAAQRCEYVVVQTAQGLKKTNSDWITLCFNVLNMHIDTVKLEDVL